MTDAVLAAKARALADLYTKYGHERSPEVLKEVQAAITDLCRVRHEELEAEASIEPEQN